MSEFVSRIVCVHCGREMTGGDPPAQWLTCQDCGVDDGILEFQFDLERVRDRWQAESFLTRPFNHWRYHELLPVDRDAMPFDWEVGGTPLCAAPRLAEAYGLSDLRFKDEGRNPTASFKDRASFLGVAHAIQLGASTVACASTGNAATSLAGAAAMAGIPAVIFVPATAPEPKLAQMLVFGATVIAVEGSYQQAYELCSAACQQFGWYNRNCAINPVLVEGKKTGGLELAEQCALQQCLPDWVAVSVGDGCTVAGIGKGLSEMHTLGFIDRVPRLLGVQASGVSPVKYALTHGVLPTGDFASTVADSIDVAIPRNWRKAVAAIKHCNGTIVTVSDDEIFAAMRTAGSHGIYGEPAAAAALAGLERAVRDGTVRQGERVVVMNTGSGLKDTKSAISAGGQPIRIPPDLDRVAEAVNKK